MLGADNSKNFNSELQAINSRNLNSVVEAENRRNCKQLTGGILIFNSIQYTH